MRTHTPVKIHAAPAAIANVALFEDEDPWGYTSNQDLMTAHGISYTIYGSADMGVVDLSGYRGKRYRVILRKNGDSETGGHSETFDIK